MSRLLQRVSPSFSRRRYCASASRSSMLEPFRRNITSSSAPIASPSYNSYRFPLAVMCEHNIDDDSMRLEAQRLAQQLGLPYVDAREYALKNACFVTDPRVSVSTSGSATESSNSTPGAAAANNNNRHQKVARKRLERTLYSEGVRYLVYTAHSDHIPLTVKCIGMFCLANEVVSVLRTLSLSRARVCVCVRVCVCACVCMCACVFCICACATSGVVHCFIDCCG